MDKKRLNHLRRIAAIGGANGTGKAKVRGSAEHYQWLAMRSAEKRRSKKPTHEGLVSSKQQ